MLVERADDRALRLIKLFLKAEVPAEEVSEVLDAIADVIVSTGRLHQR